MRQFARQGNAGRPGADDTQVGFEGGSIRNGSRVNPIYRAAIDGLPNLLIIHASFLLLNPSGSTFTFSKRSVERPCIGGKRCPLAKLRDLRLLHLNDDFSRRAFAHPEGSRA